MVNIVTIVTINAEVLNFRCKRNCVYSTHLSKYTKIQMDLHKAEQI